MSNPFNQIAATLASQPAWPFASATPQPEKGVSKTERMRAYLRQHGSATAATLADEGNLNTRALVGALLKGDLARGLVFRRNGRYFWNPQFDQAHQQRLAEAAALLRRNGYRVEPDQ